MSILKLIKYINEGVYIKKVKIKEEDVVTKIGKNMLRWFGHVERIDERRLTKEIYEGGCGWYCWKGKT
jgi:hypothetical protein